MEGGEGAEGGEGGCLCGKGEFGYTEYGAIVILLFDSVIPNRYVCLVGVGEEQGRLAVGRQHLDLHFDQIYMQISLD